MRLNAANTYHTTAHNFTTLPKTSKNSCYQAAPKCADCQEYYAPRMSQWCSVLHSSPFSFLAGVGERIGRKWMKMENHCVDPALRLYGREESTYEESTSYHLEIGHLQSIFLPGLWAQGFEKGFWGQKLLKNTKYVLCIYFILFLSIWGNLGPSSFRFGFVFCTIMSVWPIAYWNHIFNPLAQLLIRDSCFRAVPPTFHEHCRTSHMHHAHICTPEQRISEVHLSSCGYDIGTLMPIFAPWFLV
jgi:hypothetical protein